MLELLLILLGLFSNPSNTNTTTTEDNGTTTTVVTNPDPGDTGGDEAQIPPKK